MYLMYCRIGEKFFEPTLWATLFQKKIIVGHMKNGIYEYNVDCGKDMCVVQLQEYGCNPYWRRFLDGAELLYKLS